jgi:uncharacterized protein
VSNALPSRRQALEILREVGCSTPVIQHCKTVSRLAVEIAEAYQKHGHNVNLKLVEIGALLHDIGRAKTHKIDHGVVGAEIARSKQLPEPIIQIIERHPLAGITAQEAKKFGLPVKDYLPRTIEEKIILYADKRISGPRRISIDVTIRQFSKLLGPNHPVIQRLKNIHMEFAPIIEEII